ncbi:malate synthase G [Thalassotalea insulae]|uniref:Malate synthase G n=1 Tax=Thalassotalea insulae TaxID=2056778 RepID=A0ABQ6GXK7_9GAMM|nr:malate synthase G [Thalassotalea insulae]GLX79366.1 malate synthase G [Thalassotalea insulae]
MSSRVNIANLKVADCLYQFIEQQVLPDLPISSDNFWHKFSTIIKTFMPLNQQLLATRASLQQQIDQWHSEHQGNNFHFADYKQFLTDIGYLTEPVSDFTISTENVDAELAQMAGPQLVVPIMNARFALNAVNARWGSLYDALYGTDVIDETDGAEKSGTYNPVRGAKVINFARDFLDQYLPLTHGSHRQAAQYLIEEQRLIVKLSEQQQSTLQLPEQFIGYNGEQHHPQQLLFKHNGLHFELNINANSQIGQQDQAGICDILMESALTTIMDCEDSVAAVDAEDKVVAYKNWLGLNKGTLSETVTKGGHTFTRTMNQDRHYLTPDNQPLVLSGRSLMFVRNVGHLMTNNAILTADNQEVPEGILDAMVTSLIALYDVYQQNSLTNSKTGSIYIVKPKMHGPEEVAFANQLFEQVELALELPKNTIKMGIMDEERRTSVNLKNCIYQAKERVVFINTGFLDRTGDEIHTSMAAGPMARKADIKLTPWISAYEDNNVIIGLACGFSGKAQIGKGMWPIPDHMANMLSTKIAHPRSGANTAWVPSPTAATLHALHYHEIDVFARQNQLTQGQTAAQDALLTIPLAQDHHWSEEEINAELDNNAQGILGYVVRWVEQGIGCSKVPDINHIGLMEDRATLRISSQHMANWLKHNICSKEQVIASMKKMAKVVDQQNSGDADYRAMSDDFEHSIAFQAACDLIFKGEQQPSGYTEPLLHQYRLRAKAN